jgi:hypothetical protein
MDGVCPSSVPPNFWELPKNGRGLSIILVLILRAIQYLPEGHLILQFLGAYKKNGGGMSVIRSVLFLGASKKWTGSLHRPGANKTPV